MRLTLEAPARLEPYQTLEELPLHPTWANPKSKILIKIVFTAILFSPSCGVVTGAVSAQVRAPAAPGVFEQQQIVDDLSAQVDAQQKVLADLNTKISQQNELQQSTHVNEAQQNMQAQAAVVASAQRRIGEAKDQDSNSYMSQADQIQQSRFDREQSIRTVQGELQQQSQVVEGLQNQLQAQVATNVDSSLLDYFEQATAEQQAKLSQLEDLHRSLQVEAGQAAEGEDYSQRQQLTESQENVQALQGQYDAEVQKYSQMESQYQSAMNSQAKAQDQLSHLADDYDVQREKYLDLQEKLANASAQLKKLKSKPSLLRKG